ncbi:MAG: hypothetical protein HYY40_11985 [Bacteroidetes bacterium]|nr:hypothetical protein [Bacteroidota bacterium]
MKIFCTLIFLFACRDIFPLTRISVKDALLKNLIDIRIRSRGGHTGNCIEMEVKNISYDTVFLRIEAGRVLIAGDSAFQNILITGADSFFLTVGQTLKRDIFGMCMEMTDRSPVKDAKSTVGDMAGKALEAIARFIGKYNYYNGTGQHAVWVLSNNIPIESVHATDDPLVKDLHKLLHQVTGKPIPWYTLEYKQDTAHLFTGIPVKLFANFQYYLANNGLASLILYDENNNIVQKLFLNLPHHPDDHEYVFVLDVSLWKRGSYFCKLFVDDRQQMVREINL